MKIKNVCLSLFSLLVSSCAIEIVNTEACAVSGVMAAGANCAHTLSDETREMTLPELIEWLEPNKDKGPAICQSAEDFNKNKTSLEQACKMLGAGCRYQTMKGAFRRIERIKVKRGSKIEH